MAGREELPRTDPGSEQRTGRAGPGVVLVGVDDTLTAQRAASYAAGVAARSDGLLVVVHARPVPVPVWSGFGPVAPVAASVKQGLALLAEYRRVLRGGCRRIDQMLRVGDPVEELCQVASERRADMIVVGQSAARRHRLFGSVGSRLTARSQWPVLVVP